MQQHQTLVENQNYALCRKCEQHKAKSSLLTVKLNELHNVQAPYIQRQLILKSQNLDTEAGRSRVQGSQLLSELKVRMD